MSEETNPSIKLGASKSESALREEKILEFWRENKIFNKSLEKKSSKGEFVFYDGPVTANSKPVLHTMVPFSFKDAIPRYKTMRGYHVRRKGGWDTHGLPVELQVEKELGIKSKKEIEEYGIAKFNQECKDSVWKYVESWKSFTKRMGYWADQENAYVTYYNSYIESLWNVVKKVDEQKLLYKDYKVVPWCPRCGTALSSHELAQGYEDVKDLSVTAKFKVKGQENTYILAWTTTPWTLPGNVALAVGEKVMYMEVKVGNEILVLAKDRLAILTEPYEVIAEHAGSEMVGMEYEPLYPFLQESLRSDRKNSPRSDLTKAYKVYAADFVNTEDGTGIVHTAVMYGQDDFELGTKVGLPKHHLVGLDGKFLPGTGIFEGRFVRDEAVAVDVIKDLALRGLLFKKEKYEHPYPHCWRCHTALIYYARDSWYIKMSAPKVKDRMIVENKTINWEPEHIQGGRFGEWLREIKDWAISRERYWGTPLPVWDCTKCKKRHVIGSLDELKNKAKKSGNKYFIMRHGEAIDNAKHILDPKGDPNNHLTEKGKNEASESGKKLKNKKIDLIFTSPFLRTRETSQIVKAELGLKDEMFHIEDRLHEFNEADFKEVRKRTGEFLFELENKYQNKNILIVSHGGPIWTMENLALWHTSDNFNERVMFDTAEVQEIPFTSFPHDASYELDLHRPYIDEVELVCAHSTISGQACGGDLIRTKEVMDVWFDSGAMPFAQDHYPFENREWVEGPGYPADFISEAIDQTRGWFYTLHAVGVLMGRGKAYKNVICLGHLMDAKGKKMSKSLGNVVDPWEMMDKYGVDTLRLWMYSVNQPGESKNFDEKTVLELHRQVFGLLYNILAFYELYRDRSLEARSYNLEPNSNNILDQWILARLDEVIELNTKNLDNYKLLEPVRAMKDFINDLSTWYLRRSRERIKEGDSEAKQTLYFVLKTLSKLIAPFAPFTAEDIWLKLKNEKDEKSVHLALWPAFKKKGFFGFFGRKSTVIGDMAKVRDSVSTLLKERQEKNIPVRQPILSATGPAFAPEYVEILKEELNVKNYGATGTFSLDTNMTPALKAEGEYREFMRELQDMRKKLGLNPGDKMPLSIEKIYKKYKIMPTLQMHMLRVAAVVSLICDSMNIKVEKGNIISACLLHDIGNIIKFKSESLPDFYEPEGLDYWMGVKNEFVSKYGSDEHAANEMLMREIGVPDRVIHIAQSNRFSLLCTQLKNSDINVKIAHYADGRVAPRGVMSYQARMDEAEVRYKGREDVFVDENRVKLIACGLGIEKEIFKNSTIKPEDITDETVAPIIAELRGFVIK
ncbi:MAG TPA: class I tRNA ligase family protein [Candidatus Paceibacterota bacterium]